MDPSQIIGWGSIVAWAVPGLWILLVNPPR